MEKITSGTKEWADSNINCFFGCSNNCRYCYAKKIALRFKRKEENNWEIMTTNEKAINKNYRKRSGRIMFPTSHDITRESLEVCLIVLRKLIKANNEILITTKPDPFCIEKICNEFQDKKNQIQFRFTITSYSNKKLEFWEPNAPSFDKRIFALSYAFRKGFKTSVSIEPFLDRDPFFLVENLKHLVSESIWIGKMNYISRVNLSEYENRFYNELRNNYSIENLKQIVNQSKRDFGVRIKIKDSIYNVIIKNEGDLKNGRT